MSISATSTRVDAPFDVDLDVHDRVAVVSCRGTLDAASAPRLAATVGEAVKSAPLVRVDVTELRVDDAAGAETLAALPHDARTAGAELHWQGLAPDHLRGVAPVRYRARPALRARALLADLPMTLRHALASRRPRP